MEHSIFMDKSHIPTDDDLRGALGDKYSLWMEIRDRVYEKYPEGFEEWNFPGKEYGWSFRIKESDVSAQIKSDLENAKVYAEGRGVRIAVPDRSKLEDIYRLIDIKLAF